MSVLGKWLHEYQIMFMYCLVNKLFKMIYIHKKNKKEKKREHTISQNSVVFSIRKNISEDKLASFHMQEKNVWFLCMRRQCSHSIVMVAAFAKRSLLMITNFFFTKEMQENLQLLSRNPFLRVFPK